jgi:Holliday junction resolvasome RuvABC DNA-binding subunit
VYRGDAHLAKRSRFEHASVTNRAGFEDVVKLERAKQALMQLGYKARAARLALNDACADVGGDADVATLVKTVLARQRAGLEVPRSQDNLHVDATNAITQLGYSRGIATAAVRAASAHVGATTEITTLIKEALRHCRSS